MTADKITIVILAILNIALLIAIHHTASIT
jgi:hypothetical protein